MFVSQVTIASMGRILIAELNTSLRFYNVRVRIILFSGMPKRQWKLDM